jgi:uncharacterized protein (DUF58 family)
VNSPVRAIERKPTTISWQGFLWAAAGLCLALFLAFYATATGEKGDFRTAAVLAGTALVLTAYIALRSIPFLAQQVTRSHPNLHIHYEVTREGLVYLFVVFIIAVAALNTGNNLLFLILAIMLAAIVGSGILSRMVLSGIDLEMDLPERIFAGQPVVCRLKLINSKKFFPSYSLTVSPATVPPSSRWRSSKNVEDTGRRILALPVYIPYLPKASAVEQDVDLTFSHRGRFKQDGFTLSSKFPFGFLRKKRSIASGQELLVFPEITPVESFGAIPPALAGEIQSLGRDDRGHDLYGLRDYRQSDSARSIDWKATARAQGLKVREYSREDSRRVGLILDSRMADVSAGNLEKFERAVRLCASLAWHFNAKGIELAFGAPGVEIDGGHGDEGRYAVLEALATIEPKPANEPFSPDSAVQSSTWNILLTSSPAGSASADGSQRVMLISFDDI